MMYKTETPVESRRIEELRHLLKDKDYLATAIQRIAQVLSNELLDISLSGDIDEQSRQIVQQ